MDTDTLKTFLLLSKLKNFTKASEQLFVAQSTVTNRISDLERELGCPLFIRNHRKVELTPQGMSFLNYASRILVLEETARKEIHAVPKFEEYLRMGTTNTLYECFLQPAVGRFLKDHPRSSVSIILGHSLDLIQMVQDAVLDAAFTYLPLNRPGLFCQLFCTEKLLLVTSSSNREYAAGIHRRQLQSVYYLFCNFALQEVGQFIRRLFPQGWQFPFEIDNSTKLPAYILQGLGYTFLPESLARSYLVAGQMISIPLLDLDPPKITSYYIRRETSSKADRFLETI